MSADDWISCPFCSKKYRDQIAELRLYLKDQYDVLTAKEYDDLKATTESQIQRLEDEERDKSYARIDGVGDYAFQKDGTFSSNVHAYCPHCERSWDASVTVKPKGEEQSP